MIADIPPDSLLAKFITAQVPVHEFRARLSPKDQARFDEELKTAKLGIDEENKRLHNDSEPRLKTGK